MENDNLEDDAKGGDGPNAVSAGGRAVRRIFGKTMELEKELKDLLNEPVRTSSGERKIHELRCQIRDNYESLLFKDMEYAQSKEVEGVLWKLFYKRIEELRKKARKHGAVVASANPPAGSRENLERVCLHIKSYLQEVSGFYHELIRKLQEQHDLNVTSLMEIPAKIKRGHYGGVVFSVDVANAHQSYVSVHRCLICLGDLARYRELHNNTTDKDWTAAESYYSQALHLVPSNGNPHNQLAVVATYSDDEAAAVYYYLRSLACRTPFTTAKVNLNLLFEKNKRVADEGKADLSTGLKRFTNVFVQTVGVLHSGTHAAAFAALEAELLQALRAAAPGMPEEVCLQAMGTVLMMVAAAMEPGKEGLSYAQASQVEEGQANALSLLYGVLATVLGGYAAHISAVNSKNTTQVLQSWPFASSVYVAVSWLAVNDSVYSTPRSKPAVVAARCRAYTELAAFLNLVAPIGNDVTFSLAPLPEDVAMRGLVALDRLHAVMFPPGGDSLPMVAGASHLARYRVARIRFHASAWLAHDSSNPASWVLVSPDASTGSSCPIDEELERAMASYVLPEAKKTATLPLAAIVAAKNTPPTAAAVVAGPGAAKAAALDDKGAKAQPAGTPARRRPLRPTTATTTRPLAAAAAAAPRTSTSSSRPRPATGTGRCRATTTRPAGSRPPVTPCSPVTTTPGAAPRRTTTTPPATTTATYRPSLAGPAWVSPQAWAAR